MNALSFSKIYFFLSITVAIGRDHYCGSALAPSFSGKLSFSQISMKEASCADKISQISAIFSSPGKRILFFQVSATSVPAQLKLRKPDSPKIMKINQSMKLQRCNIINKRSIEFHNSFSTSPSWQIFLSFSGQCFN